MKKFILSFGLSALFLGAMAQDNAKPVGGTGPQISLDKEVHDYGTIANGANGTCEFIVTNTGDQPLIITNCKGSCGCTVPKCDTAPIKPGAKTTITVKYDTKRPGPINKSVTISSNATNAPEKVVRIKGTVEAGPETPASPVKEQSPMAPVEKTN
ncbi:MAG TPA: DUF1573 domain-containing protein [Flavobacteriales bacterium]|nr:DUF1573 domain-containing protein [Flavobacteriales bacterium]MCC6400888.1 DUF1573 domain-containing protein [Flavobacteriales bacterium]HQW85538.1 DUF1573 domain-containing protein [Flavobacteriales bacterium]